MELPCGDSLSWQFSVKRAGLSADSYEKTAVHVYGRLDTERPGQR